MNVLEVKNIHKQFKDKIVFHDFSMEVEEHEFVAIEGKSGAGKSTLLNMIGLLDKADTGDITIFNQTNVRPFSRSAEKILKNDIGYLFQNFALIEDKSVYYNLNLSIEHFKIKDKNKKISEALAQVGLSGYENKAIHECSGGEQQRVAMARLILKPCKLILADEPTGSLDIENKHIVFDLLKSFQQNGKTVIVVSHDPELINIVDRVIKI